MDPQSRGSTNVTGSGQYYRPPRVNPISRLSKKTKLIMILGIILLITGILIAIGKKSSGEKRTEELPDNILELELKPQNRSGQKGMVRFEEIEGKIYVTLDSQGGPTDQEQPAHIHSGKCPKSGEIVYPLQSPLNGQSITVLDATLEDLRGKLPLSVNIHKSPEESDVIFSCADIKL